MRQRRRTQLLAIVASAALVLCAAAGAASGDVLYDQYDNAGTVSSNSQDYETALNSFDNERADDFAVPSGPGWNVTGVEVQGVYDNGPGPATSVHVRVYANGAGNLPGTLLHERLNQTFTGGPSFVVTRQPVDRPLRGEPTGFRCRRTRTSPTRASGSGRIEQSSRTSARPGRTRAVPFGSCPAWEPALDLRSEIPGARSGVPHHRNDRRATTTPRLHLHLRHRLLHHLHHHHPTSTAATTSATTSASATASTTASTSASATTSTSTATTSAGAMPRSSRDRDDAHAGSKPDQGRALPRRASSASPLEASRPRSQPEPAGRSRAAGRDAREPHRRPSLAIET